MSKKAKILITSYSVFIIFCLILNIYILNRRLNYYINYAENNYQHAFTELVVNFGQLDTALEKSVHSKSPQVLSTMCAQIYAKAQSAQMALGSLPFSSEELGETASFISKVGDYSYVVIKTASDGDVDSGIYDTLSQLSATSKNITGNLQSMYEDMSAGNLTIYDLNVKYSDLSNVDEEMVDDSLLDSFKDMEAEFPEMPTLIYDGPYSDDVDTNSYGLLENEEEISEEEALSIAESITNAQGLHLTGTTTALMEYYTFENDDLRIDISKKGGYPVAMKSYKNVGASNISVDEAKQSAKEFLDNIGFTGMESNYYMTQNNTAIINFAYKHGDYTCYPDLIKVTVSLEDGSVLGFDAGNYMRNHTDRDIPDEAYAMDECQSLVGDDLTVVKSGSAVIPTYGKKETFCYEYICEDADENTYLIYIDTQTGKQADILTLIEDENGFLTK